MKSNYYKTPTSAASPLKSNLERKIMETREEIFGREAVKLVAYPDTVNLMPQAIRIGSLGIRAVPCEVFAAIGLELKATSPVKPSFTVSLANGYNGYLPSVADHQWGGYETWRARSSYLEVEAAPKIVAALEAMMAELN